MRPTILAGILLALSIGSAASAATPGVERWPGEQAWKALEREGVRFSAIEVEIHDVFPAADRPLAWYERTANRLHVETEHEVIREQLLFKTGDLVNARRIYETERRLRALPYVQEAVIEVGERSAVGVVARIVIDDAWSLKISVSFDSTGGQETSGYSVEDSNVLGSGKSVAFNRSNDIARTSTEFRYSDPALGGSHWTLDLHHVESSDGSSNGVRVGLPFVTAVADWSFTARFDVTADELGFWNDGKQAYAATSDRDIHLVEVGRKIAWNGDAGWRARLGLQSETYRYGPLIVLDSTLRAPPTLNSRELTGVVMTIERYHDHYRSFKNLALVDRFEDYNLGFDVALTLGRFPQFTGSTVDAWTGLATANWAARFDGDDMVFWRAKLSKRHEYNGHTTDGFGSTSLTYYLRRYEPHTLVGRAEIEWRETPDPEHELYLGGTDGLYGYPNFFRVGDRRWNLHFEDRVMTERVLFNSFRVGYAAFVEAGKIRPIDSLDPGWGRLYADVGGGFRIGSLRGAFGNVLYFMVAVPVIAEPGQAGYQIVVGSAVDF